LANVWLTGETVGEGVVMNNRTECKGCDHLPVCKDKLKHNYDGLCPYYLVDEVSSAVQLQGIQKITDLIDCEIDCIKSGNILTPSEQDIAIKVCENIKERFSNFAEADILLLKLNKRLAIYQKAINKIDDYFEYRYAQFDKEETRKYVYDVLDNLTKKLEATNAC